MINDGSYCNSPPKDPVHAAFQKIPLGKMLGKRRLGGLGYQDGAETVWWCFQPACLCWSSVHPSIPFIHQSNPSVFRAYRSGAWQLPARHARPPECSLPGRLGCPEAELAEEVGLLDVGWDTASLGKSSKGKHCG